MGENNLDKFRFSRCINFGARDGVVVGRPTEGYHVHMALVGKEALEEWGEWFELEIGKRGALRGLRGNVTSFAAGTRRAIACSFIYKPLASPRCERCASADSVQFTLYLNFVLLILKLTYIYFYNR